MPEQRAAAATSDFLKRAGEWLRYRGLPFAWAYSRESGLDKGSHAHIVMHVPPAARASFVRRQRQWVKMAAGHYAPRAQHSRPIGGTLAIAAAGGPAWARELGYALAYMLKGVTAADAHALALQQRPKRDGRPREAWGEGGRVVGKRCGCSQNIDRAARARTAK